LVNASKRRCQASLDWTAAVWLAQDELAIEEIINELDIHSDNQRAFGLPSRLIAKIFLFRIIFGGTAYSFERDPDFSECRLSIKQWEEVIERFYAKYRGIKQWHEYLVRTATTTGKLGIPTGREWSFSPTRDKRGELKWPITTIKNYPVQGLEADLMSIARVSLYNRIKHDDSILLVNSIHDSILLDCPRERVSWLVSTIKAVFEDVPSNFYRLFGVQFNLPFRGECSVGYTWDALEEVT